MKGKGISLDKAELLAVVMEGTLYGFSLSMFSRTIWALLSRRSTQCVNLKVTVACLLLLISTAHFVIDIIRATEGLVLYRDTFPGGPVGYFSDVSQWTFVYLGYVFTAQTLLGDGVVLYRCFVVWNSKCLMIFPLVLWCAIGVTGIQIPYTASRVRQNEVFDGLLSEWITSFWVFALATNLLTTALLAGRIWWVDRKAAKFRSLGESQLRPMLYIIIDAGVIYSLTLIVTMTCFLCHSNFQYVLLPMITPIVSITFYTVIVRAELANRAKVQPISTELSFDTNLRHRMGIQITTVTGSKSEERLVHYKGDRMDEGVDIGVAV